MRLLCNVLFIGVLCALQLSGVSEAKPWIKELLEFKKAFLEKVIKYVPESRAPSLKKELQEFKLSCVEEVHEYTMIGNPETNERQKPQDETVTNFNVIHQTLQDVFKKEENMAQKRLIEQIMILVQNLMIKKSEGDSASLPSQSALVAIKDLFIKMRNNQNEGSNKIVPNYQEILKILLGEKRVPDSGELELTLAEETVVDETNKSKSYIEEALGFVVEKVLPMAPSGSFNFTIDLEEPAPATAVGLHEFKDLSIQQGDDAVKPRTFDWSVDVSGKGSIWGGAQIGFGKLGFFRSPRVAKLRTEKQSRLIKAELNRLIKLCVQRKVLQARAAKKLLALSTSKS
ncbi:uncharacterized protein [Drosophila tropicalis]|uniref:uncharacterized protein n=1 Tax=Drosophila tropicalis TaxID=46794 RepID=UPI0035ABA406